MVTHIGKRRTSQRWRDVKPPKTKARLLVLSQSQGSCNIAPDTRPHGKHGTGISLCIFRLIMAVTRFGTVFAPRLLESLANGTRGILRHWCSSCEEERMTLRIREGCDDQDP